MRAATVKKRVPVRTQRVMAAVTIVLDLPVDYHDDDISEYLRSGFGEAFHDNFPREKRPDSPVNFTFEVCRAGGAS